MWNKLLIKRLKFFTFYLMIIVSGIVIYNRDYVIKCIYDSFYILSTKQGLIVRKIEVLGVNLFDIHHIENLFKTEQKKNIFDIDLDAKLSEVMKISWVKNATIERILPMSIKARIEERIPIAYWQVNNKLKLIDTEGVVLQTDKTFPGLMVVMGKDANTEAYKLFRILKKFPRIKIKYAMYVGERRWNLILGDGITLKMPDKNLEEALNKYLELIELTGVINENVISVDFRLIRHGKIVFRNKKTVRKNNEI